MNHNINSSIILAQLVMGFAIEAKLRSLLKGLTMIHMLRIMWVAVEGE